MVCSFNNITSSGSDYTFYIKFFNSPKHGNRDARKGDESKRVDYQAENEAIEKTWKGYFLVVHECSVFHVLSFVQGDFRD